MRKARARTTPNPLHVAAIGCAVLLASIAFWRSSPEVIAFTAQSMAGSAVTSVGASVPLNPDNTLAQQLKAWERSLESREAALEARLERTDSAYDPIALGSLAASIILFMLIVTNFYLDRRRAPRALSMN